MSNKRQLQAKQKKDHCEKPGCDVPFEKTIHIPGQHFSLSGCHTSHSVSCDIKQKDNCYEAPTRNYKPQTGIIKIVQEPNCVKAPHFDCKVNVKAGCVKPGTAHVRGGNVNVKKQDIYVEIVKPKNECGKPTWKVHCNKPSYCIGKPEIDYTPGRVTFDCEPNVHVIWKEPKDCDKPRKKKNHHKHRAGHH